jgi:hypothetical protein
MAATTIWLEIIRVVLGLLILLAISTLYKVFHKTKIVTELNIISLGFVLYTLQAAMGVYQAFGNAVPVIWAQLEADEFVEAMMFMVFAIAVVRLKTIFDYLGMEEKLLKAFREVFG